MVPSSRIVRACCGVRNEHNKRIAWYCIKGIPQQEYRRPLGCHQEASGRPVGGRSGRPIGNMVSSMAGTLTTTTLTDGHDLGEREYVQRRSEVTGVRNDIIIPRRGTTCFYAVECRGIHRTKQSWEHRAHKPHRGLHIRMIPTWCLPACSECSGGAYRHDGQRTVASCHCIGHHISARFSSSMTHSSMF